MSSKYSLLLTSARLCFSGIQNLCTQMPVLSVSFCPLPSLLIIGQGTIRDIHLLWFYSLSGTFLPLLSPGLSPFLLPTRSFLSFHSSHNTKTTSWLDPRLAKKAKPPEECREDGEFHQPVYSFVLFHQSFRPVSKCLWKYIVFCALAVCSLAARQCFLLLRLEGINLHCS